MIAESDFFREEARVNRRRLFRCLAPDQIAERLALIRHGRTHEATELAIWLDANWQDTAIRMLGDQAYLDYVEALEGRHIRAAFG
ncbi:MAG: hypothetical protein AAFQ99_03590 [Pseudomonadota bacterium]